MYKGKNTPLDFDELNAAFVYCMVTGVIRHKITRGYRGGIARAGDIATSRDGKGYLTVSLNGVNYKAHRVAWLLHYKEPLGNFQIDHIDGDKSNNRIKNLRLVNNRENGMNQRKRKDSTSGVTGVCWNKKDGVWVAYISKNEKRKHLGSFKDKFEAVCARKSAERKLGYHENHGK